MDDSTARTVTGIFLIVASIIYLVIYGFTLVAICKSKELIELHCYRIMVALGICDIIQVLFVGLVPGCMIFFNLVQEAANKAMGAVLIFGWYGGLTLAAVLSVDRLVTVVKGSDVDGMFSGKKVFIWIGAAVVYAFGHLVSYCFPGAGMMFNSGCACWSYFNTTESNAEHLVVLASDVTVVVILALCYISLGIVLKIRRKYASSGKLTPNDIRALSSACLVATNIVALEAYHFVAVYLTRRILGLGTCFWLMTAGNNSIYYLAFNGTIRKEIFKLIFPKKAHAVSGHKALVPAPHITNTSSAPGTAKASVSIKPQQGVAS